MGRLVKAIMTQPVEALRPTMPVSEARRILADSNFNHLPVVDDDGKVVGIVGTGDLLRVVLEAYGVEETKENAVLDRQFKLREIMEPDVITIGPDEPVRRAAELLAKGTFHALPVVDGEGKLLGMCTSTDLIQLLVELLGDA